MSDERIAEKLDKYYARLDIPTVCKLFRVNCGDEDRQAIMRHLSRFHWPSYNRWVSSENINDILYPDKFFRYEKT